MVIGFIGKLVKTISLKRVSIWALAMAICIVGYTSFEHRDELFRASTFGAAPGNEVGMTFKISETTKKEISELVKTEGTIIGFAVSAADVRLNTRTTLFYAGDPSADSQKFNDAFSMLPPKRPLFTQDEENNRLALKLINGEFFCAPYVWEAGARHEKKIDDLIVVCRSSLPPYYGHFAGFVSVFLNVDPDVEQQLYRKQLVETLATTIFFRDVVPSKQKDRIN